MFPVEGQGESLGDVHQRSEQCRWHTIKRKAGEERLVVSLADRHWKLRGLNVGEAGNVWQSRDLGKRGWDGWADGN